MGRKKRKHASRGDLDVRSLRDEQLREKLSTLLERGKYQRSLEIGKEVRRRGLDEYHDLVEKAYRLRAAELAGKDLYGESAVIVENTPTTTAPMDSTAPSQRLHSGRVALKIATRSPCFTPAS